MPGGQKRWSFYAPINVMPAGGVGGGGGGRAWGGDLTFFKNLQSNSLPTGKSFQSNATKFPHLKLHIAVNPKAGSKKGTIKISPKETMQSFINVAASPKIVFLLQLQLCEWAYTNQLYLQSRLVYSLLPFTLIPQYFKRFNWSKHAKTNEIWRQNSEIHSAFACSHWPPWLPDLFKPYGACVKRGSGKHMLGVSLFRPSRRSNISTSGEERFKYLLPW